MQELRAKEVMRLTQGHSAGKCGTPESLTPGSVPFTTVLCKGNPSRKSP